MNLMLIMTAFPHYTHGMLGFCAADLFSLIVVVKLNFFPASFLITIFHNSQNRNHRACRLEAFL